MSSEAGGAEEDRISIVVSVEADGARQELDGVSSGLDAVDKNAKAARASIDSLSKAIPSGIESLKGTVSAMKEMLSGISSIMNQGGIDPNKAEGIGRSISALVSSMSDGMKGLEGIDAGRLASLANGMSSISSAAESMKSIPVEKAEQLKGTLDTLAESASRAADVGRGVDALRRGLSGMPSALSGFDGADFSKSAGGLANALSTIESAIERVPGITSNASALQSIGSGIRGLHSGLTLFGGEDLTGPAQNLSKALGSLSEALGNAGKAAAGSEAVKTLGSGIRQLHNGLMLFSKDDYGPRIQRLVEVLNALYGQTRAFSEAGGEKFAGSIGTMAKALSSLARAIEKLSGKGKQLADLGTQLGNLATHAAKAVTDDDLERFSKLSEAIGNLHGVSSLLGNVKASPSSKLASMASKALGAVSSKLESLAKDGWGALVSGAQKYLSVMGKVVSVPIGSMREKLDSVAGSLNGIVGVIGRIVMYRALWAVVSQIVDGFSTGLQNLYQWALITGNTFAGTMDSMATSMQYFQNSVGGAASELLDALAPALETVINWAVSLINMLNQLIAALTGHSVWRKAVRAQKSFADASAGAADSTGKATKAAKEYERTVLSFDELNKMNKPSDSGSGGGGGGGGGGVPDYGSMFEEAPIDDFYKQLANTDDWTELGKRIADGINSWESQIDWDSIDKIAATWSKRIWTAFNGFVHERDWSLFGYTIARGLNVGLHFIDDVAQNADFTYFGAGISGALNKAVDTIDWQALGRVMTDRLKVSLEMLHGFMRGNDAYSGFNFDRLRDRLNEAIDAAFSNIDWNDAITDITDGIAQVARTFVSGLSYVVFRIDSVVQGYDWASWGSGIAAHLNEAVLSIDWGAVGRFLMDGLRIAFEGLHGFLQTFDWNAFGDGIEQAITSAFNNIDWSQAGMDVNRLANRFLDVIEQAFGAINWGDVDSFISGLNIPQLLSRALSDIVSGTGTIIINLLQTNLAPLILAWAVGKIAVLGMKIGGAILRWKLAQAALQAGNAGGLAFSAGLTGGMGLSSIGQSVAGFFTNNVGAAGTVGLAGSAGSALGLALGAALGIGMNLDGLHKQVDEGFSLGAFAETVGSAALTGASIGAAFGGPVGAGIGGAIGAIVGGVETIVANWQEISDFISNNILPGFQQFFGGLIEAAGNLVKGIGEKLSALGSAISDAVSWLWDHVPQPVKDVLSGIIDFFHSTFDPTPAEAKEYGSDTGQGLSDGMDGKAQNVGNSASGLAEKIRSGIGDAVSNASTWGGNVAQYVSGGLSRFAGNAFSAASGVASNIQSGIGGAVSAAGSWGSSVASYVAGGMGNMVGRVYNAASNVARNISNVLGGMWRSASAWGGDIATSIANGLWGGIRTVSNAARSVAQTIRNFLHFSEPDIGPLSDFHTYMPDMLQSMAEGISRNSYLVTDSISDLSRGMSLSIGTSFDSSDMPDAGDLISDAVERGMVSVALGQSSGSDKGTTVVLRVDSEDLAKAVMRGSDRLRQRNPFAFD